MRRDESRDRDGLEDRDHYSWEQVYLECNVRGWRP